MIGNLYLMQGLLLTTSAKKVDLGGRAWQLSKRTPPYSECSSHILFEERAAVHCAIGRYSDNSDAQTEPEAIL
jgi:hypothetical protein